MATRHKSVAAARRSHGAKKHPELPPLVLNRYPNPYDRAYRKLEYWRHPFDRLDGTLQKALEIAELDLSGVSHQRSSLAAASASYRIHWSPRADNDRTPSDRLLLGNVELRKVDDEITEVIIERLVRGVRAGNFEPLIESWKGYVEYDKKMAEAIHADEPPIRRGRLPSERTNRRGRKSHYTEAERDETVRLWEMQKAGSEAKTLEVFLVDRFGDKDETSMSPSPIVARSTFYTWRSDYLARERRKTPNHKIN